MFCKLYHEKTLFFIIEVKKSVFPFFSPQNYFPQTAHSILSFSKFFKEARFAFDKKQPLISVPAAEKRSGSKK